MPDLTRRTVTPHMSDFGRETLAAVGADAEDAAPVLRVYMLGRFRAVGGTGATSDGTKGNYKTWQFFKCLLSSPRRGIATDQAFELFWPNSAPDAVGQTFRTAVFRLRTELSQIGVSRDAVRLVNENGRVSIHAAARIWVDADEFERLLDGARRAEDPLPILEEADALYSDHYLVDDLYVPWASERRDYLKSLWTELQLTLAQHREKRGSIEGAIAALDKLIRADPCDERAAVALMTLLDRSRRRSEVARVYRRLVRSLEQELETTPSRQTAELYRQIMLGQPPDDVETAPAPGFPTYRPGWSGATDGSASPMASPEPASEESFFSYTPSYPFPTPPRLVGREPELATLERVFERVVERSLDRDQVAWQTVLIGAAAGTGKSTLVGTFLRRAHERGALCLVGGSYDDESVTPLGPFRDALADMLLPPHGARLPDELRATVADLTDLIPELRYHPDLPKRPLPEQPADADRLFSTIHALLWHLAARRPVLLCLEDLHAADAHTLTLFHHLARQTRRLPVMLVATFRSDEVASNKSLSRALEAMHRDGVEQIGLATLSPDESADLTTTLLDGPASQPLVDSLYAATGGNPFYLEQLVLAMREDGQIAMREGVWFETGVSDNTPPLPIKHLLERRLRRLSESCLETLAMAAVLGHSVDQGHLLASLAPRDTLTIFDDLDQAVGARILAETSTGYAFGHAMLREVLYWGLTRRRRRQMHLRAGEALESLVGDRAGDRAADLAYHFTRAGQSAEIRARSLGYSLEAGRRAAELSASQSALSHFVMATELLEQQGADADPAQWLDALEGRGNAERELSLSPACITSFRRVLHLSNDAIQRSRAHGAISYSLQQIGDADGALAEADSALRALEDQGDAPDVIVIRIRLTYQIAYIHFLRGRYRDVLRLGETILPDAQRLDQWRPLFWAHSSKAWGYMGLGRIEEAVEHHGHALAAAEHGNNKVIVALAHSNLGNLLYYGGQFDRARQHLERAISLYNQAGSSLRAIITRQTLGRIFLAQGDPERARELANIALPLAREGQDRWEAECHDLLGAVQSWHTEWEAAEASFERAIAIKERVRDTAGTIESLLGLGLVAQRRGDWVHAREMYVRAVEAVGALDPSPQEVAARRHLGRLLWLTGDEDGALLQLGRAFRLASEMPHSIEYAPTMLAQAEVRWRTGDLDGAIEAAETALAAASAVDTIIEAAVVLATFLAMAQRPDAARPHVAEALRHAQAVGTPRLLGFAYLVAGRVAAVDDLGAAEEAFTASIEYFEEARALYARALALRDYAKALLDHSVSAERARAMLDDAAITFEQLGAEPALARVHAALGTISMPAELIRP